MTCKKTTILGTPLLTKFEQVEWTEIPSTRKCSPWTGGIFGKCSTFVKAAVMTRKCTAEYDVITYQICVYMGYNQFTGEPGIPWIEKKVISKTRRTRSWVEDKYVYDWCFFSSTLPDHIDSKKNRVFVASENEPFPKLFVGSEININLPENFKDKIKGISLWFNNERLCAPAKIKLNSEGEFIIKSELNLSTGATLTYIMPIIVITKIRNEEIIAPDNNQLE